jgi:predicted nucleic acid-binding protein
MIITKKIFLDETSWYAIIDRNASNHRFFAGKFQTELKEETKFFTSNIAVGNTISKIKSNLDADLSVKFNEILDDAHLGNHLRILWIGRRTQKEALRWMRKHPQLSLHLYDFAHAVFMQRRRINTILSERVEFKKLGYTVISAVENK